MKGESPRPFSLRDGALLAWIAGTALFFFLRFTLSFYHANETAIRDVLSRLSS